MSYSTIDGLRSQLGRRTATAYGPSDAYASKMLHQVPDAPVVDRVEFILDHCRGKGVVDFGASGSLHQKIRDVAAWYIGIDREEADGVIAFDLDDVAHTELPHPKIKQPDVIVCGEVLEHLTNPGWFLTRLHRQYAGITTIITVPNALSAIAAKHICRGIENVNRDHVAWYSFVTLKRLLQHAGYTDIWFGWYNGQPLTAEGLVMVVQ